jgi:hypothetical protein
MDNEQRIDNHFRNLVRFACLVVRSEAASRLAAGSVMFIENAELVRDLLPCAIYAVRSSLQ